MSVPFVRGGTSDGTPVLLDGVRLFNAFHLGGLISAINPEPVERATLLAGSGGEGLAIGSLSGATMHAPGATIIALTLLGIGWHLTNFANVVTLAIRPWPAFGIEGDGVYGYFDCIARSRPMHVLVQ